MSLRSLHLRVLDKLLNPDQQSMPVAFAQGCLAIALGIGIVITSYIKKEIS